MERSWPRTGKLAYGRAGVSLENGACGVVPLRWDSSIAASPVGGSRNASDSAERSLLVSGRVMYANLVR